MDLQELLARIEALTAKDVELGLILRDMVLYVARLERAHSKKGANNGN